MASALQTSGVSDTVSVTPDGTILVDAKKLLDKPHIRQMMNDIRSKVVTIRHPRRRPQAGSTDLP